MPELQNAVSDGIDKNLWTKFLKTVSGFPALQVARKTGDENFTASGNPLNLKLLDFWKWSVSDLVSNATRGILAEFLVASRIRLFRWCQK